MRDRLLTLAYIVGWLFLACWAAHAQPSPALPIYCKPDVIRAMRVIWSESGNGTTGIESTFLLNGTPESYRMEHEPLTGERMKQQFHAYPGSTFAVFHVHPNMSGIYPSTPTDNVTNDGKGDTWYADKYGWDVYVVSRGGLTVYRPSGELTIKLRNGLDWASQKGCF
jgi:hypothetical protein